MRIDSGTGIEVTGKAKISASPNHELQIESASPSIRLVDTDNHQTIDIRQSGSACYIDFDNTVRFRYLANAERFRIDSNGVDVTGDITMSDACTYLCVTGTTILDGTCNCLIHRLSDSKQQAGGHNVGILVTASP